MLITIKLSLLCVIFLATLLRTPSLGYLNSGYMNLNETPCFSYLKQSIVRIYHESELSGVNCLYPLFHRLNYIVIIFYKHPALLITHNHALFSLNFVKTL